MAGLLISAGCWGRATNKQPEFEEVPRDSERVVVVAHLHTGLLEWVYRLKPHYDLHAIVMVRDPWVQLRSRMAASSQSSIQCRERYDKDYRASFRVILNRDLHFTLVPYEALLRPKAPAKILGMFNLVQTKPLYVMGHSVIFDANAKYYDGE